MTSRADPSGEQSGANRTRVFDQTHGSFSSSKGHDIKLRKLQTGVGMLGWEEQVLGPNVWPHVGSHVPSPAGCPRGLPAPCPDHPGEPYPGTSPLVHAVSCSGDAGGAIVAIAERRASHAASGAQTSFSKGKSHASKREKPYIFHCGFLLVACLRGAAV